MTEELNQFVKNAFAMDGKKVQENADICFGDVVV